MATVPCRCCHREISADQGLCWACAGRPEGLYIHYPLTDFERGRIPETCGHHEDAPDA